MTRGDNDEPLISLDLGPADQAGAVDVPLPVPTAVLADLFATLDKAVRSQRLYQPNNPVYRGFIAAAEKAIAELWDRVTSLTAGVEEGGFRCFGQLFEAPEGRDTLQYLFYKDGIRIITLVPGFENEVEQFLDVVNQARMQDQRSEDDMVTLLWQHEFTSFRYSYVDALAEGLQVPQSSVPKLAGSELTLVPQADQSAAAAADGPPGGGTAVAGESTESATAEAGEPPLAGVVNRDDFEETLYFLEPAELTKLQRELDVEMRRPLKEDVLTALFDRLEDGLPEWRTEILRILRQMLPVYLGAGDLSSATRVLMELSAMVENGTLSDDYRDDVQALFRELSEPAVLAQLLRSLEDGSIDPAGKELGIFLQHLGPAAMPVLLASIERGVAGALQQRLRSAMQGLATAHQGEVAPLLRHPDPDVVRGAARLCGQLGMTDAAPALTELLKRPDATVRRAAVEALVRIRSSIALEALQRVLTDTDREVRIAAARGLTALRYPPARPRLEQLLGSRTVRDADLTEKIAFFEAYGTVANEQSVAMLDRMLNGRRLLGRQKPEMRACAAMALGRVGSPAARAALQRSKDDPNPMVRSAVQKSLRQEPA